MTQIQVKEVGSLLRLVFCFFFITVLLWLLAVLLPNLLAELCSEVRERKTSLKTSSQLHSGLLILKRGGVCSGDGREMCVYSTKRLEAGISPLPAFQLSRSVADCVHHKAKALGIICLWPY